jgi:hypothetical protein
LPPCARMPSNVDTSSMEPRIGCRCPGDQGHGCHEDGYKGGSTPLHEAIIACPRAGGQPCDRRVASGMGPRHVSSKRPATALVGSANQPNWIHSWRCRGASRTRDRLVLPDARLRARRIAQPLAHATPLSQVGTGGPDDVDPTPSNLEEIDATTVLRRSWLSRW